MSSYNVINADYQTGVLSIRETEKEYRAYIEFHNGQEDLKVYSRDDNEEYILKDLELYHGYTISTQSTPLNIEEEEHEMKTTTEIKKLEPLKTQYFATFGCGQLKDFNVGSHEVLVMVDGATDEELREALRNSPIGNNFCTTYPLEYSDRFEDGAFIELEDLIKQYYTGGKENA